VTDDEETQTTERKRDHVDIILEEDTEAQHNAWDEVTFVHEALPEVDHGAVDPSTTFLGCPVEAPLMVASMTGGYPDAEAINDRLAEAAARHGLGMGVGSQRAAIDDPETAGTYSVIRDHDVPFVAANIGAPQLVEQPGEDAFTPEDVDEVIDMVDADALVVHLNYLQEAVQPEGDLRARGVLDALDDLTSGRSIPVVAKETGAGIQRETARNLRDAGVEAIDVGGLSGTTFAAVEGIRAKDEQMEDRARLGALFRDWGIPTPVSVQECTGLGVPVVATGGLGSGLDVARGLALGADMTGMASAALYAADRGEADDFLESVLHELRTAMFLTGSETPEALADTPVVVAGETATWMDRLGHDPADLGRGRRLK
jgi:isopentenyl-diphosphate delta-isomerase